MSLSSFILSLKIFKLHCSGRWKTFIFWVLIIFNTRYEFRMTPSNTKLWCGSGLPDWLLQVPYGMAQMGMVIGKGPSTETHEIWKSRKYRIFFWVKGSIQIPSGSSQIPLIFIYCIYSFVFIPIFVILHNIYTSIYVSMHLVQVKQYQQWTLFNYPELLDSRIVDKWWMFIK